MAAITHFLSEVRDSLPFIRYILHSNIVDRCKFSWLKEVSLVHWLWLNFVVHGFNAQYLSLWQPRLFWFDLMDKEQPYKVSIHLDKFIPWICQDSKLFIGVEQADLSNMADTWSIKGTLWWWLVHVGVYDDRITDIKCKWRTALKRSQSCQNPRWPGDKNRSRILLTLPSLKIFLAAVTEAWILRTFPGSPAEMNMQTYCKKKLLNLIHAVSSTLIQKKDMFLHFAPRLELWSCCGQLEGVYMMMQQTLPP